MLKIELPTLPPFSSTLAAKHRPFKLTADCRAQLP
jgi:hypothetical protein